MPDLQETFSRALTEAAQGLGVPSVPDPAVEPSALPEIGDYSSALAFRLAGLLRRPPREIADELARRVAEATLEHCREITVSGAGYVNFRIDFRSFSPQVLEHALHLGAVVSPDPDAGAKVIVEHTATNPNKAAHVGHLRNACIGDTVARLLRARGHEVEVQNYIDDTGVQVADVLVGIRHLGLFARVDEPFDRFCSRAYVEVCRRYQAEPELVQLRARTLRQIEDRDGEVAVAAKELASKIVDAHLQTMARAGIGYDLLTWESDIIELGFLGHALDWMQEAGVIRQPKKGPLRDCWVLPLDDSSEDQELGQGAAKVLVKSDGVATYTGKDVAYHLWKFGVLGLDFSYQLWSPQGPASTTADPERAQLNPDRFGRAARVVNVIDQRQTAPQVVVKEALRRLGFETQAAALHHLAYEVVALSPNAAAALGVDTSEGKATYALSGRQGIDVGADDLLDEAERQVRAKARDQTVASRLAASAVRYYLLRFGLNSIINFDFGEALRTSGDTGVYLQYAHARACGILAKVAPLPMPSEVPEPTPSEQVLIKLVERFPRVVAEAADGLSPSTLASYTFSLATAFNDFYEHSDRLYQLQDEVLRGFRRQLVEATRSTLARALELLGLTPLPRI
ncbi:MAG TPA: arginine--tRNA ligase [Candidatus Dormibacteraeota bacterium]|nr:arginine--tRNA ligase [Candidatus Dormibacteraeota bacterium]